ncbi:MAG: GIY-YIG nuclease family protein, partial [Symploca sp. SIO1C2]|nr:GIY-YIG nuclease family protein [Symploca sp. SIO1C2]
MFDDSAYRNKPGFIYLIHAQETDRYKIGLTTRSVEARFAELNSSQSP